MTKVDLKNVVATTQKSGGTIGYLCWYSVSEDLYEREHLRRLFIQYGLNEEFLPKPIRAADAFRRATKHVETRNVDAGNGVLDNYLVRNVVSNKDIIQRNIVKESRDLNGRKLGYSPDEAILIFNRQDETFRVAKRTIGSLSEDLADEAKRLYEIFLLHHNAQAVRSCVLTILKTLSPTPVRPSGGVYFVPIKYEDKLRSLCGFLSALDKGEGFMVPLDDTKENRDMVRTKLYEHLKNTLKNCTDTLRSTEEIPKGVIKQLIEEAKRVVSDFKDYRETFGSTIENMETYVDLIRQQIQALLEK
ncbi:DUF6744 family protein [Calidifontibacillus erzurumensis]|uniref:DUF6744 family protein n=1 Tax=Calidifontibacillus erzurumensis TaxID=2741433 RepID=UPI0035B54D6F